MENLTIKQYTPSEDILKIAQKHCGSMEQAREILSYNVLTFAQLSVITKIPESTLRFWANGQYINGETVFKLSSTTLFKHNNTGGIQVVILDDKCIQKILESDK